MNNIMLKNLLYISFFVLAGQTGFAQGIANSNGANINVSQRGNIVTTGYGKLINNDASVITNDGTITIADELVNNGTATINNDGTVNVAGNWTDNAGNGVYSNRDKIGVTNLNGTATQTIAGSTSFENLTINNSAAGSAVSFSANQTVENTTTFTDGVLSTGANTLISTSNVGSVITGNSNTSFINGNLQKHVGYSNCLDFDGSNDWVNIGSSIEAQLDDFTFETWMYWDGNANQWFMSFTNNSNSERIQLEVHANKIYFGWASSANGMGWNSFAGTTNIVANTWYHVAVTNSSSSGKKIYVNGVLENSSTNTLSPSELSGTITGSLGRLYNTGANYFDGKLDESRIWSKVLTQTEIQQTMNGLLAGTETGLVAYYQFEDGAGSGTLTDVTGNGNTGTLTNMDNANDWVSNSKHNTFAFPVGNGTNTTDYALIDMEQTALTPGTFTYLDAKFDALATGGTLSLTEEGTGYSSVAADGEWHLVADNAPTSIKYNIKASTTNISGLSDNRFAVVKRPTASTDAADWNCAPCGFATDPTDGINSNNGAGRLVADGYALRRGFTSFSKFGIALSSIPLPIELLEFNASLIDKDVMVNWITASEINADYYIVERSKNSNDWEFVGQLKAAGNSSEILKYEMLDENSYSGISYYRLVQYDFNGKYSISNTEVIIKLDNASVGVYPNPNNGNFTITQTEMEYTNLSIKDVTGRIISTQSLSNKTETIEINEPSGIYFVELKSNFSVEVVRVVVK
tara:strand:- start:3976 stop:6216 length:2241 start_codon:yes stop_codon:yes gene_type:complete